jgi:hypothetical protein
VRTLSKTPFAGVRNGGRFRLHLSGGMGETVKIYMSVGLVWLAVAAEVALVVALAVVGGRAVLAAL